MLRLSIAPKSRMEALLLCVTVEVRAQRAARMARARFLIHFHVEEGRSRTGAFHRRQDRGRPSRTIRLDSDTTRARASACFSRSRTKLTGSKRETIMITRRAESVLSSSHHLRASCVVSRFMYLPADGKCQAAVHDYQQHLYDRCLFPARAEWSVSSGGWNLQGGN